MNSFADDGLSNLTKSASLLRTGMSRDEVEIATLYFSFGMERICKAALAEINPALVLKSSNFSDIVAALYTNNLIANSKSEIRNIDQIEYCALIELIRRACLFYKEFENNKATLHKLRVYRNILAHRDIRDIDYSELEGWLLSVFHPVVSTILDELKIDSSEVFSSRVGMLENEAINSKYPENVRKRTNMLLKAHEDYWKSIEKSANKSQIERNTDLDLHRDRDIHDNSYESYDCPACGNRAVLEIEPDFDYSDGHGFITGVYPVELRCHFCELKINDQEILGCLDVDKWSGH